MNHEPPTLLMLLLLGRRRITLSGVQQFSVLSSNSSRLLPGRPMSLLGSSLMREDRTHPLVWAHTAGVGVVCLNRLRWLGGSYLPNLQVHRLGADPERTSQRPTTAEFFARFDIIQICRNTRCVS